MKSLFGHKNNRKRCTVTLASVGMPAEHGEILKKSLAVFAANLNSQWIYIGDFEQDTTIDTMGSKIDAEYLLIDIDDELGKRVWYFLAALRDANKTIAYTQKPWDTDALLIIAKPFIKTAKIDSFSEFNQVVTLLNNIDPHGVDTPRQQDQWSFSAWLQSKVGSINNPK